MKPTTAAFLAKAREDLQDAQTILAIGLVRPASRCAYYAAFYAAEAFIVERTGKIAKTHGGVHSEFARVARDLPQGGHSLSSFLAQAYKHKQISDYGPTQSEEPSFEESAAAVPTAIDFVARIETLIAEG